MKNDLTYEEDCVDDDTKTEGGGEGLEAEKVAVGLEWF